MGKEVPPISTEDLTPESPDPGELPSELDALESQDSQTAILHNTAVMSIGTSLSRITGFIRVAALTYALGVTVLADTFNVANTTPNIIYELALGGVLSSVFVPVFVDWMQTHGREAAWDVSHRVMTLTVVVLSALAIVGIVAAPAIFRLYTSGDANDVAAQQLGPYLLRWFLPQIVFYGIGAVAAGLLNAHRKFAAPMFAPILNNLIAAATFITIALLPGRQPPTPESITRAQTLVLAIGTTLGVVAMSLVLVPFLRRLGWRWRWNFRWRHEAVTRIAHLAKWTVVYVVANQIGLLIIIVIATGLTKGDYTAYVVAFIVFQLPHAIFAVSIFTAILPGMSGRWVDRDVAGYRALLTQGIRTNALVLIPAALGYMALALPIVRLLFQHGATDAAGGRLIASILVAFAVGLFPFSLFQLMLRAFYATQDSRTPALINIAAVVVNTAANLLFVFVFDLGIQGLALGYSTGYAFAAGTALVLIRRRTGDLDGRRTLVAIAKITVAGVIAALAARAVASLLADAISTATLGGQVVQVFGAVAVGVLVFVLLALILRIEEVDTVKRAIMAKAGR